MTAVPPSTPTRRQAHTAIAYGVIAVLAFQCALGLYASALNKLFYSNFGPFFDSMSYLNNLATLHSAALESGWIAAAYEASVRSTIVYPWVVAAPLASIVPLSRLNAVWIQVAAAALMQLMIFIYFVRIRFLPALLAFVYSAVFCVIAATFFYNGGLSDFRMDLLQYLFMAAVMAAYLVARSSRGLLGWAVLGFFAGLLCLARATSVVYLAPIFLILAIADASLDATELKRAMVRWAVAGGVAAILAGWYFVANFAYLHYYYFVWNEDANSRLPLSLSIRHLGALGMHIGVPLGLILIGVATMSVLCGLRRSGVSVLREINWRPLVFTAVPIGYLVLSGAGLNPFVSIVGCAGVIMFLLDPLRGRPPVFGPALSMVVIACLLAGGAYNAALGIGNNFRTDRVPDWMPRQEGLKQAVNLMLGAASESNRQRAYSYTVVHVGSLATQTIQNALIYDNGFVAGRGEARRDGLILKELALPRVLGSHVDDKEVATLGDQEKAARAVDDYSKTTDFVFIATEQSRLFDHNHVTRFVPEVRRLLLASPDWEQIGKPVAISPIESVLLLRNRARMK